MRGKCWFLGVRVRIMKTFTARHENMNSIHVAQRCCLCVSVNVHVCTCVDVFSSIHGTQERRRSSKAHRSAVCVGKCNVCMRVCIWANGVVGGCRDAYAIVGVGTLPTGE